MKDVQGLALVGALSICKSQLLLEVSEARSKQWQSLHDAGLWECLSRILQVDFSTCGQDTHDVATLPLALGGLALRSAERVYWRVGQTACP